MKLYTIICYDREGNHIRDITVSGIKAATFEQEKFSRDTGGYALVGEAIGCNGERIEVQ